MIYVTKTPTEFNMAEAPYVKAVCLQPHDRTQFYPQLIYTMRNVVESFYIEYPDGEIMEGHG